MKTNLLLFTLVFMILPFYSWSQSDSIQIKQRLGKVYQQHGKTLKTKELYAILGTNERAAVEMEQARRNETPAILLSIAGGAMIGWPVGSALAGGDPQWWLAGAGAGLILCSIPLQIGYNKHLFNAVTIYNSDLKKIGILKPLLRIDFARSGIGVRINF